MDPLEEVIMIAALWKALSSQTPSFIFLDIPFLDNA